MLGEVLNLIVLRPNAGQFFRVSARDPGQRRGFVGSRNGGWCFDNILYGYRALSRFGQRPYRAQDDRAAGEHSREIQGIPGSKHCSALIRPVIERISIAKLPGFRLILHQGRVPHGIEFVHRCGVDFILRKRISGSDLVRKCDIPVPDIHFCNRHQIHDAVRRCGSLEAFSGILPFHIQVIAIFGEKISVFRYFDSKQRRCRFVRRKAKVVAAGAHNIGVVGIQTADTEADRLSVCRLKAVSGSLSDVIPGSLLNHLHA